MISFERDPLYRNYFKFLELFRGGVEFEDDYSSLRCEREEFSFAVPHTKNALDELSAASDFTKLLIAPEMLDALPASWKAAGGITFMEMSEGSQKFDCSAGQEIRISWGNDSQVIEHFSDAQCAGFLESPADFSKWAEWLSQANRKCLNNKDVKFGVAHSSKEPAAGTIAVRSEHCTGIYGVATKPAHRKKGLGTLLLSQLVEQTPAESVIGLQVETGSYAHAYYRKLGFHDTFELRRLIRRK